MSEKYIDRGKDAESTMLTPKMMALVQAQAEEFKQRAEEITEASKKLIALIDRQELSGLITRDLIRAKDELRLLVARGNKK